MRSSGYILNGSYYLLSEIYDTYLDFDPSLQTQSGTEVVDIAAGSTFGFWVGIFQNGGLPGTLTISGVHSVPEPGTLALLSLGLAGLAFTRRRKQ